MKKNIFSGVIIILLSALACERPIEVVSEVPEVWFEEFDYRAKVLTIGFIDGDGDLFYTEADTMPPYDTASGNYYNILLDFFKVDGDDTSLLPLLITDRRIDCLITPQGNYKTLEGVLDLDMSQSLPFPSEADSFFITFQIIDRGLNKSNIDTTPLIRQSDLF